MVVVGAATVAPQRLTFTPADWSRPRMLTVTGGGEAPAVRFVIEKLALDESVPLGDPGRSPARSCRSARFPGRSPDRVEGAGKP